MPAHKKLTPALQDKVVAMIRGGNYIETAAAAAGISKQTLYTWLKDGARAESGPEFEFNEAVHQALAEAEVRDILIIGQAAKTIWQAAAWRRERMNPERWALRNKHEISGPEGKPLEIKHVDVASLAARIDAIILSGALAQAQQPVADGPTRNPPGALAGDAGVDRSGSGADRE